MIKSILQNKLYARGCVSTYVCVFLKNSGYTKIFCILTMYYKRKINKTNYVVSKQTLTVNYFERDTLYSFLFNLYSKLFIYSYDV